MNSQEFERKLTAIVSADFEGYSRLMAEDELATIETLTLHKETMEKLIRQYRGRVVHSTGDMTCWLSLPVWWIRCSAW